MPTLSESQGLAKFAAESGLSGEVLKAEWLLVRDAYLSLVINKPELSEQAASAGCRNVHEQGQWEERYGTKPLSPRELKRRAFIADMRALEVARKVQDGKLMHAFKQGAKLIESENGLQVVVSKQVNAKPQHYCKGKPHNQVAALHPENVHVYDWQPTALRPLHAVCNGDAWKLDTRGRLTLSELESTSLQAEKLIRKAWKSACKVLSSSDAMKVRCIKCDNRKEYGIAPIKAKVSEMPLLGTQWREPFDCSRDIECPTVHLCELRECTQCGTRYAVQGAPLDLTQADLIAYLVTALRYGKRLVSPRAAIAIQDAALIWEVNPSRDECLELAQAACVNPFAYALE